MTSFNGRNPLTKEYQKIINLSVPETEIQHCIIHQIRNSTKFVSYKDLKALMADLKHIYTTNIENNKARIGRFCREMGR
jgi:transposase-like protein